LLHEHAFVVKHSLSSDAKQPCLHLNVWSKIRYDPTESLSIRSARVRNTSFDATLSASLIHLRIHVFIRVTRVCVVINVIPPRTAARHAAPKK
jgi:hypothetical protein